MRRSRANVVTLAKAHLITTSFNKGLRETETECERESEGDREKLRERVREKTPYTVQHIIIILENHTLHGPTTLYKCVCVCVCV